MSEALLFGRLFHGLRTAGLPVTLQEWMTLMEALDRGMVEPDLGDFYHVARALLVKDETRFDTWDQVFTAIFGEGDLPTAAVEELLQWLEDPRPLPELSPEEWAALDKLPLDELRRRFEDLLEEQQERHDGGSRWIGTGGTSPFGHGGRNPAGVRVGGRGGGRSALQVASERRFRDYRNDRVLDTRATGVALRKLRRLSRSEGAPELDIEETIDATCRNAGDLTIELRPPRENQARVLLLMDAGGSMDPHTRRTEALFSAASQLCHWRRFDALFFHNCPYETLYSSIGRMEGEATADMMANRSRKTFLIMVGDAAMAPSELTHRYGAISYQHRNTAPGLVWLHRLRQRFERAVWLNPIPERWWTPWSTHAIGQLFPMFPLTVTGIDEAVDCLLKRTPPPVPDIPVGLLNEWA